MSAPRKPGWRTPILMAAAALGLVVTEASGAERDAYVFGVVPQQSASRLARIWTPLFDHLGHDLDRPVRFATAKDIPTFEACLALGAYDFAYMNPYHYTVFSQRTGYVAFAKQSEKRLRGILVVRADSRAAGLDDIGGSTIAFPSPAAFGASVLPRAELIRRGVAFEPKYVKSHDSVYRAVAAGLLPAGGGVLRTFATIPDALRAKLRVLYRTDAYTPHAFAAHPRVAPDDLRAIARNITSVKAKRPSLLDPLGMVGIEGAADPDWNDVRALDLTQDETDVALVDGGACHSG